MTPQPSGAAPATPPRAAPATTTTTVPSLLAQLANLLAPPPAATGATPTTTTPPARGDKPASRFFLQEGSPEDARLLRLIETADAARRDLDRRTEAVQVQLAGLPGEIEAAHARVRTLEADEQALARALDEAQDAGDAAHAELSRLALAAYVGEPVASTRFLNALFALREPGDMGVAGAYLHASFGSTSDAVKRFRARQVELDGLIQAADEAHRAARSEREHLEERKHALDAVQAEMGRLSQQLTDQRATEEELRRQAFDSRDEFERRIAELARESEALTAQLRTTDSSLVRPSTSPGVLASPLADAPVASGFGPRVHPIFGGVRDHTGVDLGAPDGTPITAAAGGRVVSAGTSGGYGNLTVIQHDGGLATLYAHQSTILVAAGQHVRTGEVIGLVGCTGYCTGPHLHFEVRVDGTPVDPQPWL